MCYLIDFDSSLGYYYMVLVILFSFYDCFNVFILIFIFYLNLVSSSNFYMINLI